MTPRTITVTLAREDLSTIHGWSNYVRFSNGGEDWDSEDERVRDVVYDALHPFLAPCLSDRLDPVTTGDMLADAQNRYPLGAAASARRAARAALDLTRNGHPEGGTP